MGKINKEWHLEHPMARKPNADQRLEWHLEHLKHCTCRTGLPKSVLETMAERGMSVPENATPVPD